MSGTEYINDNNVYNIEVNVDSLKICLNECEKSLNKEITEGLNSSLSSDNFWICDSRSVLLNNFDKILNKYTEIYIQIIKYKNVAELMEKYQHLYNHMLDLKKSIAELNESNNVLRNEYDNIKNNLYYTETQTYDYYDEQGNLLKGTKTVTLKNYNIENRMHEIESMIDDNTTNINQKQKELQETTSSMYEIQNNINVIME